MATPISGDQSLLFSFPSLSFDLLAPIKEKIKCDPAAQKKLDRARMLHNVLATRLAQQGVVPKVDDVKKLCIEWIHGLLEATFPLESALVDAECADGAALGKLLAALDGAKEIAVMLAKISPPAEAPATAPASAPAAASSSDSPRLATEAEAAELLQNAAASASAVWRDVVPGSAPEASALGYELWEALCWRRGALRYYMAATYINGRLQSTATEAAASDMILKLNLRTAATATTTAPSAEAEAEANRVEAAAAKANKRSGAAAIPDMELLSDAHFALMLLLAARRDRTDLEDGADGAGGSDLPLSAEKTAQALKYGVYSTTHLLALAFDVEVCYWRWGACLEGKGAVVDVSDAGGEASVAAPEGEAGEWHKRACVSAHRYLHTVLVLMEGCGWETARTAELLQLLSVGRAEKVAKALKGEEGVAERETAMLTLSAPAKAMAPGNESASADGGGKKASGKKGRKK